MEIIAMIFSFTVSLILLISGVLKVVSLKASSTMVVDMNVLPKRLAYMLGVLAPFFEIGLAILLILKSSSILVNLVAAIVFLIFIFINVSSIHEDNQKNCYCFGTLIESKTGYGGLIQSLLLLLLIIPNIISTKNTDAIDVLINLNSSFSTAFYMVATVLFYTLTLMLIRTVYDLLRPIGSVE